MGCVMGDTPLADYPVALDRPSSLVHPSQQPSTWVIVCF